MQTLQLRLPDFVNIDTHELTLILASRLYEQGKLSIGQAAELAGLPKRTFMELLGRVNVSAFNYDADELERDMRNA
jgi:predicted HTH domain antitoxin